MANLVSEGNRTYAKRQESGAQNNVSLSRERTRRQRDDVVLVNFRHDGKPFDGLWLGDEPPVVAKNHLFRVPGFQSDLSWVLGRCQAIGNE